MIHYILTNPDKESRAKGVVARKGAPPKRDQNPEDVAECVVYRRAIEADPKASDDDLVLAVYKGLGGQVQEFSSQREADARREEIAAIRKKQAIKDAKR